MQPVLFCLSCVVVGLWEQWVQPAVHCFIDAGGRFHCFEFRIAKRLLFMLY